LSSRQRHAEGGEFFQIIENNRFYGFERPEDTGGRVQIMSMQRLISSCAEQPSCFRLLPICSQAMACRRATHALVIEAATDGACNLNAVQVKFET
jgi:hypothetical protein